MSEIDTNVGMGVGRTKRPSPTTPVILVDTESLKEDWEKEVASLCDLTDQATKIHGLFNEISDTLETFLENGGQFNLRVYHNGGCESIDLHQLNGEFECSFLQTKELKLHVPGELDDDGCKIA